jgi:hypothetical protein
VAVTQDISPEAEHTCHLIPHVSFLANFESTRSSRDMRNRDQGGPLDLSALDLNKRTVKREKPICSRAPGSRIKFSSCRRLRVETGKVLPLSQASRAVRLVRQPAPLLARSKQPFSLFSRGYSDVILSFGIIYSPSLDSPGRTQPTTLSMATWHIVSER